MSRYFFVFTDLGDSPILTEMPWNKSISIRQLALVRCLFFGSAFVYYFFLGRSLFQVERLADLYPTLWIPFGLFGALNVRPFSPDVLLVLKYIWGASLLFSAVGFLTRASTAIAAVLGIYLLGLFGCFGQFPLREILFFWSLILFAVLPAGQDFSLDRVLKKSSKRAELTDGWPVWLMVNFFLFTYFVAFLHKIYRTGFDYVTTDFLALMMKSHGAPLGEMLGNDPTFGRVLGAGTLAVEFSALMALFFPKIRRYVVLGLLALHVGVELTMNLYFYPLMMCYVWFLLELRTVPAHKPPPVKKKILVSSFISLFFLTFVFEAVRETNWLFTDMKFYAFKIEENNFSIDVLNATLSSGRRVAMNHNEFTRPLEQHVVIWGVRRIQEDPGNPGRLPAALQLWKKLAVQNLHLPPDEKVVGLSYERRIFSSHAEDFNFDRPLATKILGQVGEN